MKSKVIFLDFDGVLNSHDYMWARNYNYRSKVNKGITSYPILNHILEDDYGDHFDPRCVMHLDSIINNTNCDIVISSSWRRTGLESMKEMWEYRKLPGNIIGITGINHSVCRGQVIQDYIDLHNIEKYCIIDDDSDMLDGQDFVKVNGTVGLCLKDCKKIINILNS